MRSRKYPYLNELYDVPLLGAMPYLPLTLEREGNIQDVFGLVDSGSTVNVLPYSIGLKLGATWEKQTIPLRLKGIWQILKQKPYW